MRSLLFAPLIFFPAPLFAQTDWFVDAGGSAPGSGTAADPYTSIQFALSQTSTLDGDNLLVASGTYAESIDYLGKQVAIRHDGIGSLPLIEGDGVSSAVSFVSGEGAGARLEGFEVTGSLPNAFPPLFGGAVLVDGAAPFLSNVTVRDSSAGVGGGIALLGGSLTLANCSVLRCESLNGGGGGIHVASGILTVDGGSVEECGASGGDGGGIEALFGSTLELRDLLVRSNRVAFSNGGGISASGAASLTRVEFRENGGFGYFFQVQFGAGIYAPNAVGNDCEFRSNGDILVQFGGGASGGTWTDTLFQDNTANGFGGGLYDGVAVRCRFLNNSVAGVDGDPSGPGGGAASSTLIECLLEGNSAAGSGGGAWSSDLLRCIVRNNSTIDQDVASGGGISTGTAVDCLIEGNRAIGEFGAGVGGGAQGASLMRCVVRGNIAVQGAGVSGGSATHCTIVHNLATGYLGTFGGGARGANITNSILWGNLPDQTDSGMTSFSNVEDGSPGMGNIDAYPGFFGPGSDLHLLAGSPCIDAGDPNSPPDPDGSRADMGVFPFEVGHLREDSTFCVGTKAPLVIGEVSVSGPPARIVAPGNLFILSNSTNLTPRPFQGLPNPSALCLTRGIARVSAGQLEITPLLLATLGLGPGDRLLIQAYSGSVAEPALSRGLDLQVLP